MTPELEKLLKEVKNRPPMTKEEIAIQRRSWVIGEMMLMHPEMTYARAAEIYDAVSS